jgi:predicted PhzF superfamily epimerase YddE/YHI9
VAAFIADSGQLSKFGAQYTSSQGAMVGRAGKIAIAFDAAGGVRVGGQSVTCIDGTIDV